MVIMFLLGAASTSAAVASTYAAVAHVVDGCHRLRPERLLPRAKGAGVNGFLTETAKQVSGHQALLAGERVGTPLTVATGATC